MMVCSLNGRPFANVVVVVVVVVVGWCLGGAVIHYDEYVRLKP